MKYSSLLLCEERRRSWEKEVMVRGLYVSAKMEGGVRLFMMKNMSGILCMEKHRPRLRKS